MPNQDLIAYFQQNLSAYPLDSLKQQALSQGYSPGEVEEASRLVQGGGYPQTYAPPVSSYNPTSYGKNPAKEGAIVGAIIAVIFSVVSIPLSFLSSFSLIGQSAWLGGLGLVSAVIMIPFALIFGAIFGALYGYLVIMFQEKLPGDSLFKKTFYTLLIIDAVFTVLGFATVFLNPVSFLLRLVLSVAGAFVYAKFFASRMGA